MTDDRKQQRIVRRKEKVQRLIIQQEVRLAAVRPEAYQHRLGYLQAPS